VLTPGDFDTDTRSYAVLTLGENKGYNVSDAIRRHALTPRQHNSIKKAMMSMTKMSMKILMTTMLMCFLVQVLKKTKPCVKFYD
jgi:hypothetical protein